jgi:hypothetical protein
MGKKVYTVNGKMFLFDDETGKLKTIYIKEETVSERDWEEFAKILANERTEKKENGK